MTPQMLTVPKMQSAEMLTGLENHPPPPGEMLLVQPADFYGEQCTQKQRWFDPESLLKKGNQNLAALGQRSSQGIFALTL